MYFFRGGFDNHFATLLFSHFFCCTNLFFIHLQSLKQLDVLFNFGFGKVNNRWCICSSDYPPVFSGIFLSELFIIFKRNNNNIVETSRIFATLRRLKTLQS